MAIPSWAWSTASSSGGTDSMAFSKQAEDRILAWESQVSQQHRGCAGGEDVEGLSQWEDKGSSFGCFF